MDHSLSYSPSPFLPLRYSDGRTPTHLVKALEKCDPLDDGVCLRVVAASHPGQVAQNTQENNIRLGCS